MKEFFGKIFASIVFVLVILFYWSILIVSLTFFISIWEFIIRDHGFYPDPSALEILQAFFGIWLELIKQYWNPLNWF